MWHTSLGDRTLIDAEARLFRAGVRVLIDALAMDFDEHWLEDDTVDYPTGVALFDALTPAQRIASIHRVSTFLLTDVGETPEVTAIDEATVAAIFMEIRDHLAIEVDFRDPDSPPTDDQGSNGPEPNRHRWREVVLAAYHESETELNPSVSGDADDDPSKNPNDDWVPNATIDARDMNTWDAIIERLIDGILWDRDFEMADLFLDADPGVAKHRREMLGIGKDYFSGIAEDPLPNQVAQMIAETRDLTQRKPR